MEKHRKVTTYEVDDGNIRKSDTDADVSVPEEQTESIADPNIAFELFREKRENRAARKRAVTVCVASAFIALALGLSFFLIFRITSFSISGSAEYTQEQLTSAIKNPLGGNLFFTDTDKLVSQLSDSFPSLKNIKINRKLPGTLYITVEDSYPEYYMELDGEYLLLSDDVRIIGSEAQKPEGLVQIISCGVKTAVMGSYPEFETDTHLPYLLGLLKAIKNSTLSENIVKVDMSEKFDIELYYLDRFIIKVGNTDSIETKLKLAQSYIDTLCETDRGTIDCTSITIGSFTPKSGG